MFPHSIWLKEDEDSSAHNVQVVPPNCWKGEVGCVVGPFSSREVAEYFANIDVDFGDYELSEKIFPYRDSWYIEVRELA